MARKKMSFPCGAGSQGAAVQAPQPSRSIPMTQQQPDLGSPSAPQTLVRLIGCSDPKARSDQATSRRQPASRPKPHH